MTKLFATIALCTALSGCAVLTSERWPEHGAGGLAELLPASDCGFRDLHTRIDDSRAKGAAIYAAADLDDAELLLARLKRECSGGLHVDAEASFQRLQHLVGAMENRLRKSRSRTGGAAR